MDVTEYSCIDTGSLIVMNKPYYRKVSVTGGKDGIQKIFILSVQLFYKSTTLLNNEVQLILIICGNCVL